MSEQDGKSEAEMEVWRQKYKSMGASMNDDVISIADRILGRRLTFIKDGDEEKKEEKEDVIEEESEEEEEEEEEEDEEEGKNGEEEAKKTVGKKKKKKKVKRKSKKSKEMWDKAVRSTKSKALGAATGGDGKKMVRRNTKLSFSKVPATPSHTQSVPATPSHSQSVPATPSHSQSVPATPSHSQSVPATPNKWQNVTQRRKTSIVAPLGKTANNVPITASNSQFVPAAQYVQAAPPGVQAAPPGGKPDATADASRLSLTAIKHAVTAVSPRKYVPATPKSLKWS